MSRADELREQALKLVEAVMKTEETLSAEFLQGVRADVHRLEMAAWELGNSTSKRKEPPIKTTLNNLLNVGTMPTQNFCPKNTMTACHSSDTAL